MQTKQGRQIRLERKLTIVLLFTLIGAIIITLIVNIATAVITLPLKSERFEIVETLSNQKILVDTYTGVYYLATDTQVTPMYNADGTLVATDPVWMQG